MHDLLPLGTNGIAMLAGKKAGTQCPASISRRASFSCWWLMIPSIIAGFTGSDDRDLMLPARRVSRKHPVLNGISPLAPRWPMKSSGWRVQGPG